MSPNTVVYPLRRLNELGQIRFEAWLNTKDSDGKSAVEPPRNLYFDAETSVAIEGVGTVPMTVANKMEMASAINGALGDKRQSFLFDEGLWTAMTILYIDLIMPAYKGKRHVYGKSIYVMPSYEELRDNGKAYRHRVWGPCYLEARFGVLARAFLSGDISRLSDGFDALIYYNQAYTSVLQAVDALYMTVDGEFAGDGNDLDDHQKEQNLRDGSIRAFIEHCRQIGYTHSLAHVSPEVLIDSANKLEFQPQLANARRRRDANSLPWASMSVAVAA
ncbi:hypothetical protein G6L37_04880 [Agrobacterium rubi]|nr:hypothetical protein [Agrobacterium rubi]NTF24689.1 hypothetical protein [Agrobacterium rubi]